MLLVCLSFPCVMGHGITLCLAGFCYQTCSQILTTDASLFLATRCWMELGRMDIIKSGREHLHLWQSRTPYLMPIHSIRKIDPKARRSMNDLTHLANSRT